MTAPTTDGVEMLSTVRPIDFENAWYEAATAAHFWMAWRFRELLRLIEEAGLSRSSALDVLEVGGGHGVARSQLESQSAWRIDLTDLNLQALSHRPPSPGRTLYYDVNDREPSLHERYDVIVLLDVLEHVDPPVPFLESVTWHLKPGGTLMINVPALPGLFSAYDDVLGHYRRYTSASLRHDCEAAGLACGSLRYWGFTMLPLLAVRAATMRRLPKDPAARAALACRGMMPPHEIVNAAMKACMRVELKLLRRAPLGTSLLCAARKPIL